MSMMVNVAAQKDGVGTTVLFLSAVLLQTGLSVVHDHRTRSAIATMAGVVSIAMVGRLRPRMNGPLTFRSMPDRRSMQCIPHFRDRQTTLLDRSQ